MRSLVICFGVLVGATSSAEFLAQSHAPHDGIRVSREPDASLAWAEFTSALGAFKVVFPGYPQESLLDIPTPDEPLKLHIHRLLADAEYSVMWADYPFNPADKGPLDKFLDIVVRGAIAETGNSLLSESEVEISGYPCRDLHEREQSGRTMNARICIVGPRYYQVAITYPVLLSSPPETEARWEEVSRRFLNSFQHLPERRDRSETKH